MSDKIITRSIWILSLVSLLTDTASEMLYPIMPVYLQSIGFSVLLIGILEGLAELTSGFSKGYFGNLSDKQGVRLPFVRLGYFLSAFSKPMFAVITNPFWVFGARTLDRFGKGIRTGARDALLSAEATPETKGRVFGFHRGMDTTGAVIGPLFALVYLYYAPHSYKPLFYFAFIPGVLSVFLLFLMKEKKSQVTANKKTISFFAFIHYWKMSSFQYKKLTTALLVFTLFNSSDYFLLLKLKASGFSDTKVIALYIFYNSIYALSSFPLGKLADKFGFRNVIVAGLLMFAIVYGGMAFNNSFSVFIVLFIIYGIYAAATEGISKAWITNICKKEETATAIGSFTALQSICTMLATFFAGIIWTYIGSGTVFVISAVISSLVAIFLYIVFMNVDSK